MINLNELFDKLLESKLIKSARLGFNPDKKRGSDRNKYTFVSRSSAKPSQPHRFNNREMKEVTMPKYRAGGFR